MDNQNPQSNPPPANPPVENPVQPAVPTQSTTTPPSPKSFLSNKLILVIIILIVLLGVGGTYLALNSKKGNPPPAISKTNPTSAPTLVDETANWKTYVSNQYGYSIKYPSDLVEFKQNRFFLIGDSGRADTADGFGSELQILWRGNKPAVQAAKEELSTRELKPTTINNYPGIEVVASSNPDPNFAQDFDYYLSPATNDKTIRITFSSQKYSKAVSEASITKMRKIALQILSTLKFTDQTTDTSNWKTYQGQGYSVRYPENWISGGNGQGCITGIHMYPETPLTAQYTPIQKTCPPSDTIFIYSENNLDNLSVEQFIKQKGGTIGNISPITVSNILSQKEIDAPGTVTNVNIYVPFGGKIYTIRWLQGSSAISEQTFNQILSTFKFN